MLASSLDQMKVRRDSGIYSGDQMHAQKPVFRKCSLDSLVKNKSLDNESGTLKRDVNENVIGCRDTKHPLKLLEPDDNNRICVSQVLDETVRTGRHENGFHYSESEHKEPDGDSASVKSYKYDQCYKTNNEDKPDVNLQESDQPHINDYAYPYCKRKKAHHAMCHSFTDPTLQTSKDSHFHEAFINVTGRCDSLISALQETNVKYNHLRDNYKKNKTLFYVMTVVNIAFIVSMVVCVPFVLAEGDSVDSLCFNCSELDTEEDISLETLTEVKNMDGRCCFKSLVSVFKSIYRYFDNELDGNSKSMKSLLSMVSRRVLELEVGNSPHSTEIVGNLLQALTPKDKIALHLESTGVIPTGKDFQSFNKIRWNTNDGDSILKGDVSLSDDGLNIKIKSAAYYFLYIRVQFSKSRKLKHVQTLQMRYLVYRNRGSVATYIHEAKVTCEVGEKTQDHRILTEMVLYLKRDDELFVSVGDEDKSFLSTESGSHVIGLFEI